MHSQCLWAIVIKDSHASPTTATKERQYKDNGVLDEAATTAATATGKGGTTTRCRHILPPIPKHHALFDSIDEISYTYTHLHAYISFMYVGYIFISIFRFQLAIFTDTLAH